MPTLSEALAIAIARHRAGELDLAEEIYRRILAVEPEYPHALNGLGVTAYQRGAHESALEHLRRAIAADPREPSFHNNLGIVYRAQGLIPQAVACHERALELYPEYADAHLALGKLWHEAGLYDQAIACYRRAATIAPDSAEIYNNLGASLLNEGLREQAVACFDHALALRPDYTLAHSNRLAALHYDPEATPASLFSAHAEYERLHASALRPCWRPHGNAREPDRPLRLGFLSPAFCTHPVGYFLVGPLEELDRQQYPTFCYSDVTRPDEMTAQLRAAASEWRDVTGMSDQRLAEAIQADRIDVLFDLSGHAAGGKRLLVFARKPAPIQIGWLDYPGTTGLQAIDYILADQREIPPQSEPWYQEKVLRLPDGYVCYAPPSDAPSVGSLPALGSGSVSFGSFNFPPKISPQAVAAWSRVLRQLPRSRLLLAYRGLDQPQAAAQLHRWFAGQGIGTERLDLRGGAPHRELLDLYNQIDVALDTLPYNGGLTTCEALWMGVPVVTCPGETFAGRHSLSHLSAAGLTETIARDLDEYVEIAVRLAGDLPRLAACRAGLRQRLAQSPLCDRKRFVGNLLRLVRTAWRSWCA